MSYKVDARGLSCPEPVVLAKKAVEGTNEELIEVLVDNIAARENVSRFGRSCGCQVEVATHGEDYLIRLIRS